MDAAVIIAALVAVGGVSGCSTLDRAYKQEVTWTNVPVVHVQTNMMVVARAVPGESARLVRVITRIGVAADA